MLQPLPVACWKRRDDASAAREIQALRVAGAAPTVTEVYADSGVENVNGEVDALLATCPLRRVLAQVEVAFSNSMIESWWRSLKHNWLFLNSLDSLAAIEKLVAFYVEQHNSVMPHSAFRGATPEEVFFGRSDNVEPDLIAARCQPRARLQRVSRPRTSKRTGEAAGSHVISRSLHLHHGNRRRSGDTAGRIEYDELD